MRYWLVSIIGHNQSRYELRFQDGSIRSPSAPDSLVFRVIARVT